MSEGRKNAYGYYGVHGSLAYDFRPNGWENAGEYSGKTEAKQKIKTKGRAGVSPALFISVALSITMLIAALMCSAELVVLSEEIYTIEKKIDELEQEQTRLKVEHGFLYSPDEIERYAIEMLGMQKPSSEQIVYINVPEPVVPVQEQNQEYSDGGVLSFIREYFPG